MGNLKRLLAWMLTVVMLFSVVGNNGIVIAAATADETNVNTEELEAWAAGITDEEAVAAKKDIWMDTDKTVDERVEALLSVMTLEEKAAQMVQPDQNEDAGGASPEKVKELGIGSMFSAGGSTPPTGNSAQDWADRVNAYKEAALESRLGIPLIYGVDAVHGHNNVDDAVLFPHNIGFAAAGNTELAMQVGQVEAEEIRATGIQWTFTPTLGVVQDERWGRYYETFGEDVDLVADMGAAFIKGLQGTDAQGDLVGSANVAASAKHYIGEGQAKNGANQGDIDMTMEEFEQMLSVDGANVIKPYEEAIAAGAKTVMASFNSVDGKKCHGSKRLLTDILKGERTESNPLGLDFKGFVVSDYAGLQQIEEDTYKNYYIQGAEDKYTAQVAASIDAGVDMFMEPSTWSKFITATVDNVKAGIISPERIDDAVSRILKVKFEMGLFEEEVAGEEEKALLDEFGSDEHRAIAKQAVEESLVVLKNDQVGETGKTALQLAEEATNIMVAGYKADDIGAQCGGWSVTWQGSMDSDYDQGSMKITTGTTIYEGFVKEAGENKKVTYNARGKIATNQDVAIVIVGEEPYAEGAGDRTLNTLVLPEDDLNVIKTALDSKGDTPTVLVITTGRPVAIADFVDEFDAVVQAWLPGTEGDGIASVMLNSDKEFKGTLPLTWTWYPQDLESKFIDSSKVLFPFGTGLKKDGTSINEGGQTAIPETKPEEPEDVIAASIPKYKGAIDIDANNGILEGEWNVSGDFGSYNIATETEVVDGVEIGYAEYNKKDWANAKWKVYFRQAGTYKVTARIKITAGADMVFVVGDIVGADVSAPDKYIKAEVTNGYADVDFGTIEAIITEPGIYGVKVMDADTTVWTSGHLKANLDYLQFECIEPIGEKDTGTDADIEKEDPTDETPLESTGNIISDDAVQVYFTSTENTQDDAWHRYPIPMANQMSQKASLDLTSIDDQDLTTISVNPNKEYQEVLGFGTSLEESTIGNVVQLSEDMQEEFLRMLVDPDQAGMTLFRVTIGTSDFTGQPFYTYYDGTELTEENAIKDADGNLVPDWYNTTGNGFSIQKDIDYGIVPVVQKLLELAKEYGVEDEVRIFASSWTPPGWTKEETEASKSYKNNDLRIKGGALKDECIDEVAMYYTRYLEEYAKQGIDIYAITLQNEPLLEIDYPSCHMTGTQEGKLAIAIKEAIAESEILSEEQKKVKLWAFDHNPSDAYNYVKEMLAVEGANEAMDGVAFHDYSGSLTLMQQVLDELLNKNGVSGQTVNLTERAVWGTEGANSIITYLRNSAISYNSWVTMLDSNQGKHQWLSTPAPTMFSRTAGSDNDYWPMPEYYITGQFARFIRPGYVRVDSNLGSLDTVTNVVFKNPETGELVAVVVNDTEEKQNFKFVCDGAQFIGAIPAQNVATYVWTQPDNIQSELGDEFTASSFTSASDGVTTGTDESGAGYITTASEDDYVDYIINVEEAGTYGMIFEQLPSADGQKIGIYQGDELLREVVATKTWNSSKVDVRASVTFEKAGIQQIRIKMTPGVKLFSVALDKMPAVHNIPGKILADQYDNIVNDDGEIMGASVNDNHQIENTTAWSTIQYKVNVPADGTYKLTVSSATDASTDASTEARGYYAIVDEDGDGNDVGVLSVDWGQIGTYVPSGDWATYTESSVDLNLTAGEHTIGIKIASSTNIAWLALGSYVDIESEEITEGSEDGKVLGVTVSDGTISETLSKEDISVNGLPTGVDYTVERISDTELNLTLNGNRETDFDKDANVTVSVPVNQANGENFNNEFTFTIKSVKDTESLVKPGAVEPGMVGDEVVVSVKIDGGTFNENAADEIELAGSAFLNYELKEVERVDNTTLNVTFTYSREIYKDAEMTIEIPVTAYSDSTGSAVLTTSVSFKGIAGLPPVVEADAEGKIILTEDKAFASNGSLADGAESGTYLDYFIDIKETDDYVVTYTVQSESGQGASFPTAWNVNRGVPNTVGTNSYKSMGIPALWTTGDILIRQSVELLAGPQTFEVVAATNGYRLVSIEIAPRKALEVSNTGESVFSATDYVATQGDAVVEGTNVGYTAGGTALDYVFDVKQAGKYSVVVEYSIESSGNVIFEFDKVTDDEVTVLGSTPVSSTGNWGTYVNSAAVEIELPEGESVVRLVLNNNGANIRTITLNPVELYDKNPGEDETTGGAEQEETTTSSSEDTTTAKVDETTTVAPTTKVPEATTVEPTTKVTETTTVEPTTKVPETTKSVPTTKVSETTVDTATMKKPAKVKIRKVYPKKKASKKVTIKFKKVKGATAYQVQLAKAKKFTKKTLLVNKKSVKKVTVRLTSKKLANKKKLYVRVRAYVVTSRGKKLYGKWSKVKSVKIK